MKRMKIQAAAAAAAFMLAAGTMAGTALAETLSGGIVVGKGYHEPTVTYEETDGAAEGAADGAWTLTDAGWRLQTSDGNDAAGGWYLAGWNGAESWYYFDADGYAKGGWLNAEDGETYYLHDAHDNSFGSMYVGWHWIGDKCYYLNAEPGNGRPLGALLRDTVTPDGYTVDADGAWNGFYL